MNTEFRNTLEFSVYRLTAACDDPTEDSLNLYARWQESLRKVQELLAYVARVS